MASVAEREGESAPISLYLALLPNTRADLEVVSRAAIAWTEVIREAAFLVDPFLEVRVELVSGTEGSINLNSLIRAVQDVANDPKKLKAIALGIAAYFAAQAGGWVVGQGYDALWDFAKSHIGAEAVKSLSLEEKREIEAIVTRIVDAKSPRERTRCVYRELRKDDVVTGVGVSLKPGHKPPFIVPRSEFDDRAGASVVDEQTIHRRVEIDRVTLTLVAPELSGDEHKWKFSLGAKTVWARMSDSDFNERLRPGSNSAPRMVTGIRMDVEIETTQEWRDGVWTIVDQSIIRVHKLSEPITQPEWLNAPVQGEEPE